MQTKRCLVTGAAGFIGSHLVERLLKDGHEVFGIDDLSTGRLENLKSHKRLGFSQGDILIHDYFPKVDWIFHLAAKADIVPSIQNPEVYHRVNVDGTVKLLEFARRIKPEKFIYAASSSCYGIPFSYPTGETHPCDPQYPYALAKWMGEQCVLHWAKVYKLPCISLRLFNVYGPRHRTSGAYGAVFGVFLAQLANGKPLTVVGNGTQSRDFTFVDDVVDAFILAAQSSISGEVFNVGTGQPQSINKLTELLGAKDLVHVPKRPGEPDITHAGILKIRKALGWRTKTSFGNGVKRMLSELHHYKDAPVWDEKSIETATKEWFENLGDR